MTTPPPLLEPAYKTNFGAGLIAYSADQMHDYAAQQVAAERERLATLQAMLREVGKWGFRGRSVAEEYDVLHGAGSWRRALRA